MDEVVARQAPGERAERVRPPRALLVAPELARTGAAVITMALARRWARHGARLAVVVDLTGVPLVAPPEEVVVEHLSRRPDRFWTELPGSLVRLVAAARGCDVVVVCSEIGLALPLGVVAARLARRPVVVAVHADLDAALAEWVRRVQRPLMRWAHRRVDGAIAVAPALVEPLVRNGLPGDRVHVVVNGIDLAAARAAAAGPGSRVPGDGVPTVVATGRLAPQKATELLVRAHARLVGELPHRVLLLNDGPERERLEALAGELGVRGSVVFAGAVSPVLPSVAAADVFCLPSRHEGLPLALLEAVALGVPCIAADCSEGVRTALDGGRVGELVPVDDVDALTDALARHLRDPGPLRARARGGPAHADTFDLAVMADGWASALRELSSGPRRPLRPRRRTARRR